MSAHEWWKHDNEPPPEGVVADMAYWKKKYEELRQKAGGQWFKEPPEIPSPASEHMRKALEAYLRERIEKRDACAAQEKGDPGMNEPWVMKTADGIVHRCAGPKARWTFCAIHLMPSVRPEPFSMMIGMGCTECFKIDAEIEAIANPARK